METKLASIEFGEYGQITRLIFHDVANPVTGEDIAAFIMEYDKARIVNDTKLYSFKQGVLAASGE